MDKIDRATRSRVMASVHSENTKPEMRVRSMAHCLGFRFRLHRKNLPGKPDLVFPSRKLALFVHGCFWHGHDCPRGCRMPATNMEYWQEKISKNMKRDAKVKESLQDMGWRTAVIWECEIKSGALAGKLTKVIGERSG